MRFSAWLVAPAIFEEYYLFYDGGTKALVALKLGTKAKLSVNLINLPIVLMAVVVLLPLEPMLSSCQ